MLCTVTLSGGRLEKRARLIAARPRPSGLEPSRRARTLEPPPREPSRDPQFQRHYPLSTSVTHRDPCSLPATSSSIRVIMLMQAGILMGDNIRKLFNYAKGNKRRAVYDYVVYMRADGHDPLSSLLFLYALSPLRSTANAILDAARRASFH